MTQGLKVRDSSGKVVFDSWNDENVLHYETITFNYASTANYSKTYPELVGQRLWVFPIFLSLTFDTSTIKVTYSSSGVPTLTYTMLARVAPNEPMNLIVCTGATTSTSVAVGAWGARFPNKNGRYTVSDNYDVYVHLGNYSIPASSSLPTDSKGQYLLSVTSKGLPLCFLDTLGSPIAYLSSIVDPPGTPEGTWQVRVSAGSVATTLRVFGRMSLNYPNGKVGATHGYRQRTKNGSRVVFDSNLKMLALATYSLENIIAFTRSDKNIPMGIQLAGKAYIGNIKNMRTVYWDYHVGVSGRVHTYECHEERYSHALTVAANGTSFELKESRTYKGVWYELWDYDDGDTPATTSYSPSKLERDLQIFLIDAARYI